MKAIYVMHEQCEWSDRTQKKTEQKTKTEKKLYSKNGESHFDESIMRLCPHHSTAIIIIRTDLNYIQLRETQSHEKASSIPEECNVMVMVALYSLLVNVQASNRTKK